jgi:hypothetical protein
MSAGMYDIYTAPELAAVPAWPDVIDWLALLKLGFRDRLITSFDHKLVQNLLKGA